MKQNKKSNKSIILNRDIKFFGFILMNQVCIY